MSRFNVPVILAACIVAASLIVSALILKSRPVASVSRLPPAALAVMPAGTPPIAQASVEEQFRTQVLASPSLHSHQYNHKTYILTDVKINNVVYAAKDDNFTVTYNYIWQPVMPPTGPLSSFCQLTNDGYGHYHDTAVVGNGSESSDNPGDNVQTADITIK